MAQDVVEDAAPAAIVSLAVARNEATANFPDGITFTLDAESTDPIANLELLYHAPGLETLSVELPPFEAGATRLKIEHPIDLRSERCRLESTLNTGGASPRRMGTSSRPPSKRCPGSDDRMTGRRSAVRT